MRTEEGRASRVAFKRERESKTRSSCFQKQVNLRPSLSLSPRRERNSLSATRIVSPCKPSRILFVSSKSALLALNDLTGEELGVLSFISIHSSRRLYFRANKPIPRRFRGCETSVYRRIATGSTQDMPRVITFALVFPENGSYIIPAIIRFGVLAGKRYAIREQRQQSRLVKRAKKRGGENRRN